MNNIRPLPSRDMGGIEEPELRFGGPIPLSLQIANWLRERILSGEFAPDADALPSEMTLVQIFPVSRDTVRRAIEILRDEGLVYTIPQRGTYVHGHSLSQARRQKQPGQKRNRARTAQQLLVLNTVRLTRCHLHPPHDWMLSREWSNKIISDTAAWIMGAGTHLHHF